MKKFFVGLGITFAVVLVIGVIGITVLVTKAARIDKESMAYVDKVTPIILANLNKETLFKYASEQLTSSVSDQDMDKIFVWFKQLGSFEKYSGSKGQAKVSMTTKDGEQITGYYEANADFTTGPATVKITTVKTGDEWKISGFHINSMALINK
jgi:hypothetical protein